MKIFIKFNEGIEIDLPTEDYIILSKFKTDAEKYGVCHKLVQDLHIDNINFLKSEEVKFDAYIAQLPDYLSDIFKASKTSLYFVMMAYENWRVALDGLIKDHQIDEIVFTELIKQNFYLPFYEAEWEITKRLSYETYDFISGALYNFINKGDFPGIRVSVIKEHSKFKLKKRIFVRRYGLLALKILLQGWQRIKTFKVSSKKNRIAKPAIFLSRGVAHSQYVVDYIKEFSDQADLYISDGLRTTGKNESFLTNCKLDKKDFNTSIDNASIFVFIKSVTTILFTLIRYKLFYERKLKSTDEKYGISYSSAITEMIIHYLETGIYISDLERFVKKEKIHAGLPKLLLTCEIYTQYTYFIAKLGKKYSIKTVQLISVAMNTGSLPQYFFCDKALFNQRQVLNDFKQNNQAVAAKCDYWGNLTFNEHKDIQKRKGLTEKLTIVVFTQPVIDEENDFVILDTLKALKKVIPLNIIIKPHPREKLEKFSNYTSDVSIYSSTASIYEVIESADLAIVKFSAVEHYLLNYGIPTVYCAFSQIAKNSIVNVINTGYEGIAYKAQELEELIINFPQISDNYNQFRNNEMLKRFENKGIYNFNTKLVEYINE